MQTLPARSHLSCAALLLSLGLIGCGSGGDGSTSSTTGQFEIASGTVGTLVEGAEHALFIPLELQRSNGHDSSVTLRLEGDSALDAANMTVQFASSALVPGNDSSGMLLDLAIADLPLLPHTRHLTLIASDGIDESRLSIDVEVEPVDAPNIYLLAGQSNMVGFSGDGTRDAGPGGLDESDPRILQLNVSANDQVDIFTDTRSFTDPVANVIDPSITIAEDPLHIPRDRFGVDGAAKSLDYIGLGLTFAKQAANDSIRDVVLVPSAWSGSAFCDTGDTPVGQWNPGDVDNPVLGNSLMFDRAVARTNQAIEMTGGILRGILWHQGESDARPDCAPFYAENLQNLVHELRLNIDADRRGERLRRADANIPFVAGTMSRGEEFAFFNGPKTMVDEATRALPDVVVHTGLSNHDDLVPPAYPCGNIDCIHFGPEALREMGRRYYAALKAAASERATAKLLIGDSFMATP